MNRSHLDLFEDLRDARYEVEYWQYDVECLIEDLKHCAQSTKTYRDIDCEYGEAADNLNHWKAQVAILENELMEFDGENFP